MDFELPEEFYDIPIQILRKIIRKIESQGEKVE